VSVFLSTFGLYSSWYGFQGVIPGNPSLNGFDKSPISIKIPPRAIR